MLMGNRPFHIIPKLAMEIAWGVSFLTPGYIGQIRLAARSPTQRGLSHPEKGWEEGKTM